MQLASPSTVADLAGNSGNACSYALARRVVLRARQRDVAEALMHYASSRTASTSWQLLRAPTPAARDHESERACAISANR